MQQPDMTQLLKQLQTPAGQQLLQFLKTNGGSAVHNAAAQAAAGNLTGAKETLAPLLDDPQLQALLRQLGGTL